MNTPSPDSVPSCLQPLPVNSNTSGRHSPPGARRLPSLADALQQHNPSLTLPPICPPQQNILYSNHEPHFHPSQSEYFPTPSTSSNPFRTPTGLSPRAGISESWFGVGPSQPFLSVNPPPLPRKPRARKQREGTPTSERKSAFSLSRLIVPSPPPKTREGTGGKVKEIYCDFCGKLFTK
ncbi:hypothetical protein T439DRAFT_166698 [Meredithblackwellia eburnea MCA 4105]